VAPGIAIAVGRRRRRQPPCNHRQPYDSGGSGAGLWTAATAAGLWTAAARGLPTGQTAYVFLRNFTRRQALAAGFTPSQIATRLLRGRWLALAPGAYVAADEYACIDGRTQHLWQAEALLLTVGPEHVVSHRSAAVAHGWSLLGPLPRRPLLTRAPRSATDASPNRFVRVAGLPNTDVVRVTGLLVTSPARTVIDLARHESRASGVIAADSALHGGLDPEVLAAALGRQATWPGARAAAAVLGLADGRADGALESLARLAFADGGLPPPELQVPVRDEYGRLIGIVDFLWRAQRSAAEVDGLLKYTSPLDLWREKQREDDLRRTGLEVVRADWREVTRLPELVVRRVRDAFDLAHGRRDVPTRFVLPPAA